MDEKEAKRLKRLEEEERERQYRANLAKRPRGTLMLTLICWCLLATVAGFCCKPGYGGVFSEKEGRK